MYIVSVREQFKLTETTIIIVQKTYCDVTHFIQNGVLLHLENLKTYSAYKRKITAILDNQQFDIYNSIK